MNASTAITETDLHAYLDGELPVTRLADVEAYLATSPQEALRLRDYQAQGRALREMFNTILEEPLPDALRQRAMQPAPSVQATQTLQPLPRWSLQRIAAGFLLAVVSGAAGWLGHGQYQANDRLAALLPLPHHAAVAHTVFSADVRRPVEITAEHEDQLVTWLSKRMGGPMRPPKLGPLGYELVGGRLLPGDNGPVAQFMYQDANGQRLTLYVSTEIKTNQDTAFRYTQEGQVNVFYWVDGKWGYAISASVPKSALSLVATSVYDQLERKP
jgi:anti-sigma factor RsiW